MPAPLAILASAGIVFTATYLIARISNVKFDSNRRNDYWDGFIDGMIIGDDWDS